MLNGGEEGWVWLERGRVFLGKGWGVWLGKGVSE